MASIFNLPRNTFYWEDVKTFHLRNQYNELLYFVINEYFRKQYPGLPPPFLNVNNCFTLTDFVGCQCDGDVELRRSVSTREKIKLDNAQKDFDTASSKVKILERALDLAIKYFRLELQSKNDSDSLKLLENISAYDALEEDKRLEELRKISEIQSLQAYKDLVDAENDLNDKRLELRSAEAKYNKPSLQSQKDLEIAKNRLEISKLIYKNDSSRSNQELLAQSQEAFDKALTARRKFVLIDDECKDIEPTEFCKPKFSYERITSLDPVPSNIDLTFTTNGLTVGAVLWLYYYERMGIFKILGALMDDYNYRGKYTISGSRKISANDGGPIFYSILMDMICTLHRLGISSNLRDRICTYQRVLGVRIENNRGITSEQNAGFMTSFNKLIDYMLEYYKAKQLAQAIQAQIGTTQPRSSVATQTSIRDTMTLLKQQFEPFQYGRNLINTFVGIATVHATLCLLNMVRTEIGIPSQYESPEEFVPAAYDILVVKRKPSLSEANRFIIYDNCASYGYRLLTDIETVDLTQLTTVGVGSKLDIWLNDVEGIVEGYRNAHSVAPEKDEAIS